LQFLYLAYANLSGYRFVVRSYQKKKFRAVRALLDTENVVMNRPAVEAGLAILGLGGDFADGVIAYEGN
jgi:hypothetical protein